MSSQAQPNGSAADRGFVHVEIERLDVLLNLVGELVINRASFVEAARVARSAHGFKDQVLDLSESVEQLGRVVETIQGKVIESRMVPISQLFDRFRPMIQRLGTSAGKNVRLDLVGRETEVDKKIVDALSEPLIHLVRNAFDHGIESTSERRDAGKEDEATITLMASHEGNKLRVAVTDDGRGIRPEHIATSAVGKGVITQEEVDHMTPQEIIALVFAPGFSTGETVSELSGRGVGMDAARRRVESLGGRISIHSDGENGTTCAISLPLTMAIIPGLFFTIHGESYAIPVDCVEETIQVEESDISTVEAAEVIHIRGEALPLVQVSQQLGGSKGRLASGYGIVVRTHKGQFCLLVERLIGRQEIVIKPLRGRLSAIETISGATITGDGNVVIVLDPDGMERTVDRNGLNNAQRASDQ